MAFVEKNMKPFGKWMWKEITANVRFEYECLDIRKLRDSDDHGDSNDFETVADLKRTTKSFLRNYMCPDCNSHRISGSGVIVRYGRIDFFKEVPYKGFWGGTKYRDERYKTVWRIYEMGLKPGEKGSIFSLGYEPGRMRCKSKGCGWEIVAPVYKKKSAITWYSANDIMNTGRNIKESVKSSLDDRSL